MGSGPPVLSPGYTLPGAEYFALQPNRSIALGPRLSNGVNSASVSVPAGTIAGANANILINPQWTYGQAFWLVRAYALYNPADNTGELQIIQIRMGVGGTPVNIFLDMGVPLATLQNPAAATVVIYERDALVTQLDIPTYPQNAPLFMDFQVSVKNNDPTNPHSFVVGGNMVWHNVSGFNQ